MGQEEVRDKIREHPRITTREIADELGWEITRVCKKLKKMIDKEVEYVLPTPEEIKELLLKYPNSRHTPQIKLWVLKDEE